MKLYHHARIETYPNDAQQAWLAIVLGGVMALVVSGIIVIAVLSTRA
ncbi:MAG TPA: hypothetical protein VMJ10_03355 [Kofleriaceae bacterium]|nr:hypothetical protein [Kofleriaceae bacterium]